MNPGEATYTMEMRDTTVPISQEKPLLIGKNIWINDPMENRLLSWILSTGDREPVDNHVFGDLEDAPYPNWVEYMGATESSQATDTLSIRDIKKRCAKGSRLFNPDTGEIFRLNVDPSAANVVGSTAGDITRNFGRGDATCLLKQGQKLLLIGPRFPEGFTSGKGITGAMSYKSFATGILDYPVHIAGTEGAEKSRGGDPFERHLFKAWKQAKDHMSGSLLFSAEVTDSTTYDANMHTETGLEDFIETNVFGVNGSISKDDLFDILLEWKLNNPPGGALVTSLQFRTLITRWAESTVDYSPGDNTIGLVIERVKTQVGTFDLIDEDLLSQEQHLAGRLYGIPAGLIDYSPLVGNGKDRDIRYLPFDREEVDQDEGTIRGEYGWWPHMEERFLFVSGVEF